MSPTHHHRPARRGARALLAGGLAGALGLGVMAAVGAAPASAAVPAGDEPGVTMRVYQVAYNLQKLCTLKSAQTPNVDVIKPTINWSSDADFGAQTFPDKFLTQAIASITVPTDGSYQFQLVSDDGSRLSIDDKVVVDHDGLHGNENPKSGSVTLTAGTHALFAEHFEAGGGQQLTVNWKKPGDSSFTLVPNSVLSTPKLDSARVTSPGNKECEGAQDSPGDGLQLDGVNPAYQVVNLRPAGFNPKVTGMAWDGDDLILSTWGGTGDPVNQTSEGKLYRLTGVKTATSPAGVTVKELVGKLREPQGVAVVDVDENGTPEYYVSEKGQLSKFVDTDGNGLLDEPKSALWTVPTSGNFHEFAFGLLHKGNKFLLNLSVSIDYGGATTNPQQAPLVDGKQFRGTSLSIDDTTGAATIVAGGLRTPNGIGFGPDGGTFVTDNQGGWLPANKLVEIKQDRFFNHMTTPAGVFQSKPVTQPVLWMPQNEIANSPSTPVLLNSGPFAGQMMIGDVTYGGLQRAFLEKVDGEYQGALFRGTQGLEAGVNEVLLGDDGTIITGGIGGGGNWEQAGKLTYGLQKLVPTGNTPFEMKSMELVDGKFKITYTEPVAPATLTDLAKKYVVNQWGYRPTAAYGGPKINEETLTVTSATPSADGTSVTLEIDGLKPNRVVHVRSPRPFASADGDSLFSTEVWYTLNALPGYVAPPAPPATQGLYELEGQQLEGSAKVDTEHAGYSGDGYVAGIDNAGAGVTSTLVIDEAGEYDVALRYANGPNPFQGPKTLSMVVNGEEQELTLPSTGTWKTWGTYRFKLDLVEGQNSVVLRYDADDDGNVNLDFLKVAPVDGTVYEAEDGVLDNGAKADTEHAGYTGSGYMGGTWNEGASTTMTVHAAEAGDHPATIRFANGPNPQPNQTKNMTVQVGDQVQRVAFPPGGSWKTWLTKDVTLPLELGDNTVTIKYAAGDEGNVNIDNLAVRMPGSLDCGSDPVAADDAFDGAELDRCRWNVINEVRAGYRVADGKLEINARPGDLSGGTTSAENLVLQKTPQADTTWTAETTVAVDGTDDYIQSGLVAYANGQNYGKLVVMNHPQNGWVVELGKITGGALGYSPTQKLPVGSNVTGVRLKLISDGEALRGQYSVDGGTTWVNVGEQPDGSSFGLEGISNPMLGLAAYNGTGDEVATFDDFTVGEPPALPDPLEDCEPVKPEAGYQPLFDGTRASLEGWHHVGGGRFAGQKDCSIKSVGDFGLMVHDDPIDYAYSLKLDWKKPGDDNSGIFVGFPEPGNSTQIPIDQGHEIQIDSTDVDSKTTGAIYNFQSADLVARDAALKPDGEWNAYEIKVEGQRIRVYLNGALVNDFTDTDPNRMNLPSYIGLQTHGNGDDVFFRNVRIKNLDAPDPEPVASTVTATASPTSVTVGSKTKVTVTVKATGATPTGKVTVRDGYTKVIGTGTLSNGKVTVTTAALTVVGTRTLRVSYEGDEAVASGTGTVKVVVKAKPKPVLTIRPAVVDANSTRATGWVKVTCAPAGVRCVGTVKLTRGGLSLGSVKVSMAGGKSSTLKVVLNSRARTLLAKNTKVAAVLSVKLDGAASKNTTVTLTR
ncbi:family 16 glycoside hydrolase [Nocardioides plantarum]|uniref:Family 16 glycoside hydrolase n=1 Tax=Nocardioides plantarum TaxID=29299 RepID=A0ABV5KIK0_9ACTN|nr:family 16 glycoside hydrolase [Nocardioides plantarum]